MKSLGINEFAATRYEEKNSTQIISVAGEVDLSSAPRLAELVRRARRQVGVDSPHIVVDLRGVEFMDTVGLEVLLEEWDASRQSDGRMSLVAREGPIMRLLEVTGLSKLFDLYEEPAAVKSHALAPA